MQFADVEKLGSLCFCLTAKSLLACCLLLPPLPQAASPLSYVSRAVRTSEILRSPKLLVWMTIVTSISHF